MFHIYMLWIVIVFLYLEQFDLSNTFDMLWIVCACLYLEHFDLSKTVEMFIQYNYYVSKGIWLYNENNIHAFLLTHKFKLI